MPSPDRAVVLDLAGVNFVDSQGSAKLTEIHELTRADDVELRLAGVKPQVRAVLEADGVVDRIGADHIHGNVALALAAATGAGCTPHPGTPARQVAAPGGVRDSRVPPTDGGA